MVKRTAYAAATLLHVLWGVAAGLAFCLWTPALGLAVVPMILVVAVRGVGGMLARTIRGLAPAADLAAVEARERNVRGNVAVTL